MQVITSEKLPIKVWAEPEDLVGYDGAMVQARNLANHPLARKWVCLMPDFHVGYGMPIGGVIATQDGVIPNAIGVDIGCGMIAMRTNVEAISLSRDQLQAIRLDIHGRVPVGKNHHKEPQPDAFFVGPPPEIAIVQDQWKDLPYQIGTLGSGNHFIEIQKDESGFIWLMIHSGSRNLGKRVCDHYHEIAKGLMKMFYVSLPDMDLAFLPKGIDNYWRYLESMRYCMAFAEASRTRMAIHAMQALQAQAPTASIEQSFDTHHNFAQMEHHYGLDFLIHRKGSVQAKGLLTIPGSMGTASYIGVGLEPLESFHTCAHGAGRVLGRKQANTRISHKDAVASMAHVVYGVRQGDYDECPQAYKDIDRVMANQADLVEPLYRLTPLAVVKG